MNQTITPETIKRALSEEQLGPIRRGEYTVEDWIEETKLKFEDPTREYSENWGTYAMLNRATRSQEALLILGRAWVKTLEGYNGPNTAPIPLETIPDELEITDLEILDRIIGQPLSEQIGFLLSKLPDIAENRARLGLVAKALETIALDRYPNLREECEELVGLRRAIGDPEPETYAYEYVMAVLLQNNKRPSEAFDLGYLEAIRECYTWSKEAHTRLEHLAELEGGPYRPLVDWLKDLLPGEATVLGYNATLLDVEELANRIIEEEGLTKATPETIKRLENKWRPIVLAVHNERMGDGAHSVHPDKPLPPYEPLQYRTIGTDKGNDSLPLMPRARHNTTLEDYGLEMDTVEGLINMASKGQDQILLDWTVYTPQGEHVGLTATERAVTGYIASLLRTKGQKDRDKYGRIEIYENDFIKGLMGLTDDSNVKAHQKTVYNLLVQIARSWVRVEVPNMTSSSNKYVKAIEGLSKDGFGLTPSKDMRFGVEGNMLVFKTAWIERQGYTVRKYTFETMPFNQYIADRFNQNVMVKESLYRTPRILAEELTPSARRKAEDLKLLSKGRKGAVLSLENNMENLGLKDWVCSTIEKKRRRYSPIIIEYDKLYLQIKGSSSEISDREKRTIRANFKKFLVYLMNNPDSDVYDFEEHNAQGSKRVKQVTIRLKNGPEIVENEGED